MALCSARGITDCTEPLPKLRVPIMIALLWSCNAPATISEADAEPLFISTTNGMSLAIVRSVAINSISFPSNLPLVDTIRPLLIKVSTTPTEACNTPPGLFRKSRTRPFKSGFSPDTFINSSSKS